MSVSQSEKAAKFDALYAGHGAFVIANRYRVGANCLGPRLRSRRDIEWWVCRLERLPWRFNFTLTGRWKNSLRSNSYLDNSICGLQAYEAGGESIDRAWIAGLGCSADIMRSCLQAVQLYGWSFREVIRLC
jgi:hypothetical protein